MITLFNGIKFIPWIRSHTHLLLFVEKWWNNLFIRINIEILLSAEYATDERYVRVKVKIRFFLKLNNTLRWKNTFFSRCSLMNNWYKTSAVSFCLIRLIKWILKRIHLFLCLFDVNLAIYSVFYEDFYFYVNLSKK